MDLKHQESDIPLRGVFTCAAPALLIALLCLAPYWNKAFTIDDTVFMKMAQQALHHPLRPYGFHTCWFGRGGAQALTVAPPVYPVIAYLLIPAVWLGSAEWAVHLIQFAILAMGLLATVRLALRLGLDRSEAMLASILVVVTPVALVLASTAMPDVPAMAIGALAIERFLAWTKEGKPSQGVAAAMLLALGPLTRPHLLLLLGVAALCVRDDVRVWDLRGWFRIPRRWAPILAGALLYCGGVWLTREPSTGGVGATGLAFRTSFDWREFYLKALSMGVQWTLVTPLVAGWIWFHGRETRRWLLRAPLAIALMPVGYAVHGRRGAAYSVLLALTLCTLAEMLADSFQRRDHRQLMLSAWALLPVPILLYSQFAGKYLVAIAPAIAILLVARLGTGWKARWPVWGLAAVLLVEGVTMLNADARFAEMGRTAAVRFIAPLVSRGEHVWVASQWGFLWYGERAGAQCLDVDLPARPKPGDYVALGHLEWGFDFLQDYRAQLLDKITYREPGIRLMNANDDAGFYLHHWGALPWAWGSGELNRYELWRME